MKSWRTYLRCSSVIVGMRRCNIRMHIIGVADPAIMLDVLRIAVMFQLRWYPAWYSVADEWAWSRNENAAQYDSDGHPMVESIDVLVVIVRRTKTSSPWPLEYLLDQCVHLIVVCATIYLTVTLLNWMMMTMVMMTVETTFDVCRKSGTMRLLSCFFRSLFSYLKEWKRTRMQLLVSRRSIKRHVVSIEERQIILTFCIINLSEWFRQTYHQKTDNQ